MQKEIRAVCYDNETGVEAYCFKGIAQPFPNHFHDHYVIGFVESGTRRLSCKNKEYNITGGNMVIFNPGDNHGCTRQGKETFNYRGLNISKEAMFGITEKIVGKKTLPVFCENVIASERAAERFRALHNLIMSGCRETEKEEMLRLLVSQLIEAYEKPFPDDLHECDEEVERICAFVREHYKEHITLEDMCKFGNMSRSTLLRAFARTKGITPYRYIQAVRISEAKRLLGSGTAPVEAAMQTGFADQSHFSSFFNMFTGLSPAEYRRIFKK